MWFLLKLSWQDLKSSGHSLWVFIACLTLGVALVAATGGLYRLVNAALLADTRSLLGGDLEVESSSPLPEPVLAWMKSRGDIALVTEVDTMLGTAQGEFQRVELQSTDTNYPLYGELTLQPRGPLQSVVSFTNGHWGVAIDPVLAKKLQIRLGDLVSIGQLSMQVRALVENQPDRNLTANWRGAPVLLSSEAVQASGLIQPGSRIEYEYLVRTTVPAEDWRQQFHQAFPNEIWEVRTFEDRSQRISERLGQIASGLIIVAYSTLFIGGLGVYNSIQTYLRSKFKTIATLRAVGLRDGRVALVYLLQVAMLGIGSSVLGALAGILLALAGRSVIPPELALASAPAASLLLLVLPASIAWLFGILTAFSFALPAIGRALSGHPSVLLRGQSPGNLSLPGRWRWATVVAGAAISLSILLSLPDALFGFGFLLVIVLLIGLLEVSTGLIQRASQRLQKHRLTEGRVALQLALASLSRPDAPLRVSLLSLGSALTLMVACTLVVVSLLRTVNDTIPQESPALVLYEVFPDQVDGVVNAAKAVPGFARIAMAPLVRARMTSVNGIDLAELDGLDSKALREAMEDEYKLSYSVDNIDGVTLADGQWWDQSMDKSALPAALPLQASATMASTSGYPLMAMEDREANDLGVEVGDVIGFSIAGQTLQLEVAAIYSQKGIQTRFWFEGIVAGGALDPFINRYVGAAYMNAEAALVAQQRIADTAPNVISVRTEALLTSARELLGKASTGLAVVAGVSLLASVLVLISVMAAARTRQTYEAAVLNAMGVRLEVIRKALQAEYLLIACATSLFSVILGSAIALTLLNIRMKLPSQDLLWVGALAALSVSVITLSLGAKSLMNRLKISPLMLLRAERQ